MSQANAQQSRQPRLVLSHGDELEWKEIRPGVRQRFYREGDDAHLEMFEVRVDPDYETPQHAHTNDEIIYVLEGSLRFGARMCGPGDTAYIASDTMYKFVAGDAGCRFLNFRGSQAGTIFRDGHG
jgi:mannose-6-phosphate isomerase-like protein (cupin superfamily)